MKTEVLNKKKEFEPIELKITIESEQELCDLWHRMNANESQIMNFSNNLLKHKCSCDVGLFGKLDELAKENNLYK